MQTMKRSYQEFEAEMENARYRIEELNIHPHKKRICIPEQLNWHDNRTESNHFSSQIDLIQPISDEAIPTPVDVEMAVDEDLEKNVAIINVPNMITDAQLQQNKLLEKFKLNPEASQLILYKPVVIAENDQLAINLNDQVASSSDQEMDQDF